MTTKVVYPHTVSQTSDDGNNFREFNNLNNVKNDNDTYAKTGQIASKAGTHKRPSTITAKNFKANIPTGSLINKITVEYAAAYEGNISIGKSTVDILNISGDNKHGKALTKSVTQSSVSWSGNYAVSKVNSSDFGLKIAFPANTKADVGYVKIKYIRIVIDYTVPNFRVSSSKVTGQYTDDIWKVKFNASNVNKTNNSPTVTIQLPSGVSYQGKDSGEGSISQSGSKLLWSPGLSSKKLSSSIILKLKVTTDLNHNIRISESISSHTSSINLFSTAKPISTGAFAELIENEDTQIVKDAESLPSAEVSPMNVLQVTIDEKFIIDWDLEGVSTAYMNAYYAPYWEHDWEVFDSRNIVGDNTVLMYGYSQSQYRYWDVNDDLVISDSSVVNFENEFQIKESGYYIILLTDTPTSGSWSSSNILKKVFISVKPSVVSNCNFSIVKLSSEELNRLGENCAYSVQSYLKVNSNEDFVHDWGKNYRIGVFNNLIVENNKEIVKHVSVSSPLCLNVYFYSDEVTQIKIYSNNSIPMKRLDTTIPEDMIGNIEYIVGWLIPEGEFNLDSNGVILPFSNKLSLYFPENEANVDSTDIRIDYLNSNSEVVTTVEGNIDFVNEIISFNDNKYDFTDYTHISDEDIFENAEYWSQPVSKLNEFVSLDIDFPYNPDYPVYVLITGDYIESPSYDDILEFTEPCIIEDFNGWAKNGNFPEPILNLLGNEELSEQSLPLFEKGNTLILDKFPLDEDYSVSDTFTITGIELLADVEYSDQLSLTAKLVNQDGISHERSIIINDPDENDDVVTVKLGGKYDLWGFMVSDIVNLEDWSVHISLNNVYSNANDNAEIQFKNLQLVIYSDNIQENLIKTIVENENVRHYGMFVKNVKIPKGLKTDTKYLEINGTDTNDACRMDIRPIEIEIEFNLLGCDLLETTERLQQVTKLFVNERDELNNPIPKRIEFSHYPDVYFMYIMEYPFDCDVNVVDYDAKVKLTIPSGTAFAKQQTIIGSVGVNKGIAKVNPIIEVTPTAEDITITEKVSGQQFKIKCGEWSSDNTVEIDCTNRTIKILDLISSETGNPEEKLITEDGDYDNDWFIINNECNFEGINCIVKKVAFTERY